MKTIGEMLNERGNTLLVTDDGLGLVAILRINDGLWRICEYQAENYPAFNTWDSQATEAEVSAWIVKHYQGWLIRKLNIRQVPVNDGCVGG